EDTVLYVEPIYIESSNESSLPEVKQVVMAYGEHIVMEENFDKAREQIMSEIEPGEEAIADEDAPCEERGEEPEDETQEETEEPIIESEETLEEISKLFEEHRQATADGDYALAGEKMEEIEEVLQSLE